jgi:uncharacterized membrane protein (DUF373 family)
MESADRSDLERDLEPGEHPRHSRTDRWLTRAETVIYIVTAALLIVAAVTLLGSASWRFVVDLGDEGAGEAALLMLDRLLLVLMLVEILYTVRESLRTHALIPEPFLIVGLIAGVRRILVITAEAWHLGEVRPEEFRMGMIELGLLTVMTVAIVVAVILLRRFRVAGPGRE